MNRTAWIAVVVVGCGGALGYGCGGSTSSPEHVATFTAGTYGDDDDEPGDGGGGDAATPTDAAGVTDASD
jgi:hypothetical protein